MIELLAEPAAPGLPRARSDGPGRRALRGRRRRRSWPSPRASSCTRAPVTPTARSSTACWRATRRSPTSAIPARPGIVHRLDRDTSGLLVVARVGAGVRRAGRDARRPRRRAALRRAGVGRARRRRAGVIDAPIGRSVRRPTRMAVREGGRTARTAYEVVAAYRDPEVSLLECRLETGRTHQIRVHLQAIGHPVVGDAAYGGQPSDARCSTARSSTPGDSRSRTRSPGSRCGSRRSSATTCVDVLSRLVVTLRDQSSASAPGGVVVTGVAAGVACAGTVARRVSSRPTGESGSVTPNRPKLAPRPTVVANAVDRSPPLRLPAVCVVARGSSLYLGRTCVRTEHPPPPYRPTRGAG